MKSKTTYYVNENIVLADPFANGIKQLYCSEEYKNETYKIAYGKRSRPDWSTLNQKFTTEVEEFITDKLTEEAEEFFGDSITISNVHVEDNGDYQFDIICNKEGMFRRQAEKYIKNKYNFLNKVEWPITEIFSELVYNGGIFRFSEETPMVELKYYIGKGEVKVYDEQDIKELVKKYGGIDFDNLRTQWKRQYKSYAEMAPTKTGAGSEYQTKLNLLERYSKIQDDFLFDAISTHNQYDIAEELKEISDNFDKELKEIEISTKHLWKESTKITLTIKQLKKLINESAEND